MKKRILLLIVLSFIIILVKAQSAFSSLAKSYAEAGDFKTAIEYETKNLNMVVLSQGKSNLDYLTSLNNLATYNSELSHYQEAVRLGIIAIEIYNEIIGDTNPYYAALLSNLAHYYYKLGNYQEAVRLVSKALKIHKDVLGDKHLDYTIALNNLAGYYADLGNYEEAVKLGTMALGIRKEVLGDKHPDYARALNNLAGYYADLGNYQEAFRLGKQALEIRKEVLGEKHSEYAASLNILARLNSAIGNNEESVRLGTQTLEIHKEVLGDKHPDYANSLSNLTVYYAELGNHEEAVKLGTMALGIRKEVLGDKHPDYAQVLNNLAGYYADLGNYEEAFRLGKQALEIRKEVLGDKHPDYANSLSNLAVYYAKSGNYQEAERLGASASEIFKETLGDKHPYSIRNSLNMCSYFFFTGENNKLKSTILSLLPIIEKNIILNFTYLPLRHRQLFWNNNKILYDRLHMYIASYPNEEIIKLGYSSVLFSKSILLNSEQVFSRFIIETESNALMQKYNEIRNMRFQLNKLYEKPISERYCDTDSLERYANELERQLMAESKEFGVYTRNLTIKWEDVHVNLKDREIAIEFVSSKLTNDSIMYSAYLLKRDFDKPVMIKLFEEKEMDTLRDDELYSKTAGSDLIWSKLRKELDGVDNIYFAPDGILHRIGIEHFPDFDNPDRRLSDRFNLYRLSSTRQIVLNKSSNGRDGVIYGGIQYDSAPESMMSESKKYDISESRGSHLWECTADDISSRARFEYLPYTLTEASLINDMFVNGNQNPLLITGIEATEESLRNLSGKKKNILHIATHGFYWEEDEADMAAKKNERLLFLSQFGEHSRPNLEDKALTRTGLLMAGAQNILSGKEIPEDVEDGILTAQEIANLDFRGLDLAVLSACQTGMGDISADGVFGLQRGFKKAGANSILMSLWKVDDEATQILMTEFYRSYLSGKSKQESLKLAQCKVRETPGFDDPEYWAAFILLDGLN